MQLDRYIQRQVAEPVDKSMPMPTPANASVDEGSGGPIRPYVSDQKPYDPVQDILGLAKTAVDWVQGTRQKKAENDATAAYNDDRFDFLDNVASIVAEGDTENAGNRIRDFIEEKKELRSETLSKDGLAMYENMLMKSADRHYEDLVVQHGLNERKENVAAFNEGLNDAVKRRDVGEVYEHVAKGIGNGYVSIEDLGLKSSFPEKQEELLIEAIAPEPPENYEELSPDEQEAALKPNLPAARFYISNAVAEGYVNKGGVIDKLHNQVAVEEAKYQLGLDDTADAYSKARDSMFARDENGEYKIFPDVEDTEMRSSLYKYTDSMAKDKTHTEKVQLSEAVTQSWQELQERDGQGLLTLDYLNSEAVINRHDSDLWLRILDQFRNSVNQKMEDAAENTLEENVNKYVGIFAEFESQLKSEAFATNMDAIRRLDLIKSAVPENARAEIFEQVNLTGLYDSISKITKTQRDLPVFNIIDEMEGLSENAKEQYKTLALNFSQNQLYDQDYNMKTDAPNLYEINQGAKAEVLKAMAESNGKKITDEVAQQFGIADQSYNWENFKNGADKNPTQKRNLNPFAGAVNVRIKDRETWQKGLNYITNGFLIGEEDNEEVQDILKEYHGAIEDIFKKGDELYRGSGREVVDYAVSGGVLFLKAKDDDKWYTLANPRNVSSSDTEPHFMDVEEFSRQYFVPFEAGNKDFDDMAASIADRRGVGFKIGTFKPMVYDTTPRSSQDYAVFTGNGWVNAAVLEKDNRIDERDIEDEDGNMVRTNFVKVGGQWYPLSLKE